MNILKGAVLRVLLILLVAAVLPGLGIAGGEVKVKPSKEKSKAIVSLDDFDAQKVTLSIENEDQNLIFYSKYIGNPSEYKKLFDFSQLDDGKYVILVNSSNEVIEKPIVIKNSEIVLEEESKVLYRPVFRVKDKALLVFHNNKSLDSYKINFYDGDGKFFSDETKDSSISRKYNFSHLPSGSYTVVVSNSEDFYSHRFEIK